MGDERGEAAYRELVNNWNNLIDSHTDYRSGKLTAEDFADVVTTYLVSVGTTKIKTLHYRQI